MLFFVRRPLLILKWLALFAGLFAPSRLFADVTITLSTSFENSYRTDCWNPLVATISGMPANSNGKLIVRVVTKIGTQSYTTIVRGNASPSQVVVVNYHHPEQSDVKDIEAELLIDGRSTGKATLKGNLLADNETPIIVALTQDQGGLNFLASQDLNFTARKPPANQYNQSYGIRNGSSNGNDVSPKRVSNKIVYPRPSVLPSTARGYSPVDAIVLGDLSFDQLSEDQWSSIITWVRDGGILVISGGGDINRLRSKQLAELCPITPTKVIQMSDFSALESQYKLPAKVTNANVIVGTHKSDALSLCTQGNVDLVVERRYGNGLVVFTAFDALSPQFKAWPGQQALWREIMLRGGGVAHLLDGIRKSVRPTQDTSFGRGASSPQILSVLSGLQAAEAPSFVAIAIFLALYIFVLVPLNYFVLKIRDKRQLAWYTIPAVIGFFTVGAYIFGLKLQSGKLTMNTCSVLEGASGMQDFESYSLFTIFSPNQAKYRLNVADPSAVVQEVTEGGGYDRKSLSDLEVEHDRNTSLKNVLINMWDHRSFDVETHARLAGPVDASVIALQQNVMDIQLHNGTGLEITDGAVAYKGVSAAVGTLAPGQSKTIKLNFGKVDQNFVPTILSSVSGPGATSVTRQMRESLANLAMSSLAPVEGGNIRLPLLYTGWIKDSAAPIELESVTPGVQSANLLIIHLPLPEGLNPLPNPVDYLPPAARPDPTAPLTNGALPQENRSWQVAQSTYSTKLATRMLSDFGTTLFTRFAEGAPARWDP